MKNKDFQKLKDDIISSVGISRQESTGFYTMVCPMCKNERKTGGFKFEVDKIVYNCFRASCGASTVYEIDTPISRKFRNLMDALHVKIPMSLNAKRSIIADEIRRSLDVDLYEKNSYQEIAIPEDWQKLTEVSNNRFADSWVSTLTARHVNLNDIYFIPSGIYRNLVAGVMYFYDKVIGFQIFTKSSNGPKYIIETISDGLLYFPERYVPKIPIIVEGFIDANCFPNTVATLHSKLSKKQAYMLKDCSEWWLLPDRNTDNFLNVMKDYPNCKIIIPSWKYGDLNEAVCNLGLIEVASIIKNSLISDIQEAKIKMRMWVQK